jgi:SNF2 family DNA or RNA helicase
VTHLLATCDPGHRVLYVMAGAQAAPEAVARAAKYLETLTPLFSGAEGMLTAPLTWSAIVQLKETFGEFFVMGPQLQAWVNAQAVLRLSPPSMSYTPPEGLTPYPWQVDGAALIAATGRAYIYDEPRTGKTITAVLGLVEWHRRNPPSEPVNPGPVLVICPASTIDPWVEAWQTWAPQVRAVAWHGPKRKALAGTADVYVTSYETARIDAPTLDSKKPRPLMALAPAAVVIDECHLVKTNTSQRSKAVRRITENAEAVVALSGTPITHDPGDLWATLNAVEPGAYPAKERWVNRYTYSARGEYEDEILGLLPSREAEFRMTMLGQERRIARADVWAHLPQKVYSVRTVDMPAKWRKVYDDFEANMFAELPDGEELSVMDVMSQYGFLTRLASAAADVQVTMGPDIDEKTGLPKRHVSLDLKAPSWKVDALLEVLAERPGEKVVVFAPSSQLIEIAGAAATEAGHRAGYIIGGQARAARTETIREFQDGGLNLICATTGAGGTGITLSKAGTLVFLQRPWALVESIQAEDRGEGDVNAERGTEVIDIVTRSSIDTRIRSILRVRAGQLADLVRDPRVVAELLGGPDRKKAA